MTPMPNPDKPKVQQIIISVLTFGGMSERKATLAAKVLSRYLRVKS